MKRFLSKILLLVSLVCMLPVMTANAANGISLSVTSGSSPSTFTVISWTAQQYVVAPTPTVVTISVDQSATLTASSTSLGGGTVSVGGSGTGTVTLTVSATTTAGAVTYPIAINPNGTTPTNYSITVRSSSPVDVGAAQFYAYSGNQINVTANVPSTLSFAIRAADDNSNTNTCALGTLTTAASSTCAYRLKVSTNASGGFQAAVAANHDLASGYATMTQVGDNASSVPGTEQYGIEVYGSTAGGRNGLVYDQPVAIDNPAGFTFGTNNSPVPTSTQNFIHYLSGSFDGGSVPSLTNTTLVKHFANISAGTAAGSYSQTVTYTVTGSF